jgi:hypothetical protein
MKNVQVIDGAVNCTYAVFQFTDEQFLLIFPMEGQDLAFAEELGENFSQADLSKAFEGVWDRPVDKRHLQGLHGTIFYGFSDKKHHFPETRRECDWDDDAVNVAQREMNAARRQQFLK